MPTRKRYSSGPTVPAKPDTATSKKQKKTGEVTVKEVVLGNMQMKPAHGANYPVELVGKEVEKLYVCEYCFKYTEDVCKMVGHLVRLFYPLLKPLLTILVAFLEVL